VETAMFWERAMDVKSRPLGRVLVKSWGRGEGRRYRTSQTRPSVAVCFLV
jgi:hypothetical protein